MITGKADCGMQYAVKRSGSSVAYCALSIKCGTRDEEGFHSGIAHFVEHTIFKGTERRSAAVINGYLDRLGGELNAFTTKEEIVFHATVLKEDYLPYGKGIYVWGFLGAQYYNEMHYSEYLDAYRIVTPWTTIADQYVAIGYKAEKGQSVDFTVDEEGKVELLSKKMKSGLIHPSYGSVYAELQETEMMEDGTFYFNYKWTVAAGSFGAYDDYFVLTEIY